MALTAKEEATLKEVAAKEDKQKQIDSINQIAYTAIHAKQDEIQAIEDQRIADIAALDK
jgi:hypothetical protein